MKVAIVSYGMGNLGSVRRALEDLGVEPLVAEHPTALFDANRIVLPGVGAFAEGMAHLRRAGWVDALRAQVAEGGKPLLGICLGMQLLADGGDEGGATDGLALVPGRVRRLDALGCALRIPHVGWNDVRFAQGAPLFRRVAQHDDFYFVHSYAFEAARPADVCATTEYGVPVTAAVQARNVFGVQFHPEKSSRAGRQVLRNFLDHVAC
jgi:glutamine amidotransferase